jgi:DNA primase
MYSKQSLETLRQRIDLIDVLSPYVDFKRAGAAYKALCPFHDEKSPSFMIQKGDTHYHCFGCGAHGDAIQFLMNHQKMSFSDAIESLAQRFQVHLEVVNEKEQGPDKQTIKRALDIACHFYEFILLNTPEGQRALQYLYSRGIDLAFIHQFRLGWAPKTPDLFRKVMHAQGIQDQTLIDAGLMSLTSDGRKREFFNERITIPIHSPAGSVIGFSARKIHEETFGGKYINTSETVLFKKSRVLFGLNHSRKRIAKERKAIIVEGQLDALRLIQAGFNITVAGQGTAFGDGHLQELLALGVQQVYLALDADAAGREAALKIGNAFQREGVEVIVVQIPQGKDPDLFIREKGPEAFQKLLKGGIDYLTFLVTQRSKDVDMQSPAHKNACIQAIAKQVREWNSAVMVHESLRKLAQLTAIPEKLVGVGENYLPKHMYIKPNDNAGIHAINPDRILETDLLRWLLISGDHQKHYFSLIENHLVEDDLYCPLSRLIFRHVYTTLRAGQSVDLLTLTLEVSEEGQRLLADLSDKRVNRDRGEQHLSETIQALLNRNWLRRKEAIKLKIDSGQFSEEETLELVKQYDALNRNPPKVKEVS